MLMFDSQVSPRPPDVEQASALILRNALNGADPVRKLIGLPGWGLPNLSLPNCEMIDGNILLWSNNKPQITINGTGNLVVFGKVGNGQLIGAISGNDNLCYIGGQADIIRLRVNVVGGGSFLYVGTHTKIVAGHAVLGVADPPATLFIGERSMLASQVSLRATDSHGIIDLESGKILNQPASIVIEPHVWLGERVSVLKGARVGAGSVVGAGALVSSDLPSHAICAGVPAKVIRTGVSWTNKQTPSGNEIASIRSFLQSVTPPLGP